MTTAQIFQAYFQYQCIISTTSIVPEHVLSFSNDTEHLGLNLITPKNLSAPARFLFLNGEIEYAANYPTDSQSLLSDCCDEDEAGRLELTCNDNSRERLFATLRGDEDAAWKFIGFDIDHDDGYMFLNFVRNDPDILTHGNLTDSVWVKNNYVSAMLMVDSFQALIEFGKHRAYILEHLYMNESDNWAITLTEIIDQQKTCRYQTIAGSMSWKITTYAPAD